MKLLNKSLLYLTGAFLVIIGIWSVVFFIDLKDEIRNSIDDGLENSKLLIIDKAQTDTSLLAQNEFGGNNFKIERIAGYANPKQKAIYKDTLMYRLNEKELEPVRILHTVFEQNSTFYRLSVISSLVEEDDLIEDAFWNLLWLFIILIFSIFIINNVVLRKVWNPFHEILFRLKTFDINKEENHISVQTQIKEFRELQAASNTLIKHSRETFVAQKQFTENASHEMQTPLAIAMNKMELLLESGELEFKEANSVAEVLQIIERLTKLNKALLLLAKIENKQYPNREKVDVNGLVAKYINDFQDFSIYKEIRVEFLENEPTEVFMDTLLANMLFSNLVKNALFHTKRQGEVKLIFRGSGLEICNTGALEPLDPSKIFNRFHKENADQGSSGLGLSICRAICDYYGFSLKYVFVEQRHCFKLNFHSQL